MSSFWPRPTSRSAGIIRVATQPMIRTGTCSIHRVTWRPDAPRFRILDGPSPLELLPRFARVLGDVGGAAGESDDPEVWIKREDLLPLAFGGNKLRNLE